MTKVVFPSRTYTPVLVNKSPWVGVVIEGSLSLNRNGCEVGEQLCGMFF